MIKKKTRLKELNLENGTIMQIIEDDNALEYMHGQWIGAPIAGNIVHCNTCGTAFQEIEGVRSIRTFKYCPECGTKMENSQK